MANPSQKPQLPPAERPSDAVLLAALQRAVRQERGSRGTATGAALLAHLDVGPRSAAARHVQTRLGLLLAAGWLERTPRHGVATWRLTEAGAAYLASASAGAGAPALGESPQHRAWRSARVGAAQELERFRRSLDAQLERGARLLDSSTPEHSDAWFALAESLARACWRLGSATHCLHEWPEPDERGADVDAHREPADAQLEACERARRQARRRGRRNVRLW